MTAFFYPIENKAGVPEKLAGLRKISNALPYLGNRRAELIISKDHKLQLRQVTGKSQGLMTRVLKILTLVPPIFLFLLACRAIYRLSNCVTVVNAPDKIKAPEADKTKVRQGIAQFCHELALKLAEEKPNESYCFSPFSIYPALGMLLKGLSAGDKAEMIKKLHLEGMDEKAVHQAIGALCQEAQLAGNASISVANAMISGKEFPEPKKDFSDTLRGLYSAEMFKADGGDLSATVDRWVDKKTKGMIKGLGAPALSDFDTVLLNAIHFKANWAKKFSLVGQKDFVLSENEKISIPFMRRTEHMVYCKHEKMQVEMVAKKYKGPDGRDLSFVIYLPSEGKKLGDLEKELDPKAIAELRKNKGWKRVELSMPKLSVETKYDEMLNTLSKMGLPISQGTLLPGVSEEVPIELSQIIHKAKMEVDEKGTVAAAVTGVTMKATAMPPSDPIEVVVNRPFAYAIMDGDTVLFRGAIKDDKHLVKA